MGAVVSSVAGVAVVTSSIVGVVAAMASSIIGGVVVYEAGVVMGMVVGLLSAEVYAAASAGAVWGVVSVLVVGTVKMDSKANTIAMKPFSFPRMKFTRIFCHFGMGITRSTNKIANKLKKLGKKTRADNAKKIVRVHRAAVLPFFISFIS